MADPVPSLSGTVHADFLDDEDGTSYVRCDLAENAQQACDYIAAQGFDYPDGTECKGLIGMRPHVHDEKCGGLIPERVPVMEKCGACGASVGRRHDSDMWRCDNGHTIYRAPEKDPPGIGCWKGDDCWYDEAPEAEAVVSYWKVVARDA